MEDHKHPQPQVAVVIVPFPAQGHLNQLLHLSHLVSSYGLPVHYAGSSSHNRQAKLRLHGWDPQTSSNIHFHDYQLPPYCSPLPKPDPSVQFPTHLQPLFDASIHLRQPVSQLLQQLASKFRRIAVIFDILLASVVQDVKSISNAESYAFVSISAFTTFYNSCDRMPHEPFPLDTYVPKCIPSIEGCYSPEMMNFIVKQRKVLGFESGRIYNTSTVVEGKYVELLKKLKADIKHFAIGPLNPVAVENTNREHRHACMKWLDKQDRSSVIYISFGSTTSIPDKQITELALGLERSMQKFIWVLRRADTGNIFTGEVETPQLPEEYEERIKNRGMVIRDWAPQLEILAHSSVGGFMSHCGWNSCMESISMGVPMVAWPMHTDQPRNAILVVEVLNIGTLMNDWTHRGELVTSRTIENVLRRLMESNEGDEIRKRAAELGEAVRRSVAEGGASCQEIHSFISYITR